MKPFPSRVQLFLLLLVLTPSLCSQQSKSEAAKAEIARIEERWLHAIEVSDLATLDSILAEDFVRPAPSAGRFISKSDLLDYFKSRKTAPSAARHIENLTVTLYETTAIARGTVTTGDSAGHATSRNLFTDVFVLRDGKWLAVSAQESDTSRH